MLGFVSAIYGTFAQMMETQVKARQYFCPRWGRFVCLNPAVLGFVETRHFYGTFAQMMETQVKVLTIHLSALGAFCLWEFRVFSTNLNILRSIC